MTPCRDPFPYLWSAVVFTVAMLFAPSSWPAEQGIRGRTALAGEVEPGVTVRVYAYRPGTFGPLTGQPPMAVATSTAEGTYQIALEPGRYVIEGLKKRAGSKEPGPEPGDLYILHSGSPVAVVREQWSAVGLSLVRVPTESRGPGEAGRTGLRGSITLQGAPVEKAYVSVYESVDGGFRRPPRTLQPVRTGEFRLRIPPGEYFILARKRARGGAYGPIEIGDLFNFYPLNPVHVDPGEEVEVNIPLVRRRDPREDDPTAFAGLLIRVVDSGRKPVAGYFVHVYSSPERKGPPMATSPATDAAGQTHLVVPPGERLYLRARATVGGPLEEEQNHADGEIRGPVNGDTPELVLQLQREGAR